LVVDFLVTENLGSWERKKMIPKRYYYRCRAVTFISESVHIREFVMQSFFLFHIKDCRRIKFAIKYWGFGFTIKFRETFNWSSLQTHYKISFTKKDLPTNIQTIIQTQFLM
jgi:hypothetical protein